MPVLVVRSSSGSWSCRGTPTAPPKLIWHYQRGCEGAGRRGCRQLPGGIRSAGLQCSAGEYRWRPNRSGILSRKAKSFPALTLSNAVSTHQELRTMADRASSCCCLSGAAGYPMEEGGKLEVGGFENSESLRRGWRLLRHIPYDGVLLLPQDRRLLANHHAVRGLVGPMPANYRIRLGGAGFDSDTTVTSQL